MLLASAECVIVQNVNKVTIIMQNVNKVGVIMLSDLAMSSKLLNLMRYPSIPSIVV